MLSTTSLCAQFENGKVYRIVCSGTPSVSLGANGLSDVVAASTSETDKAQQWYVTFSGSDYTFRNLATGRYLKGNDNTSHEWSLSEESNNLTVTQVNGNYCLRGASHSNDYGYMHKDGSNNVVSWENSNTNTQWTPYTVYYEPEELQAIWTEVENLIPSSATIETYQTKLNAIFADEACTELNSTYKSKSVSQIQSDDNYLALPAALQNMVLKVKNNNWDEANAVNGKEKWDNDYAKKFRVQMYEPYSIEGEVTGYLGINAHCNMDNPTGIYANAKQTIYLMVEGEIADGAELWLAFQNGHGATSSYNNSGHMQLHKGLNAVPYFFDGCQLWINYVVHTYNSAGATISEKFPENRKLSKYSPLKIHIEGGHINGFYNAIGDFRAKDSGTEDLWGEVDNDDDWRYYKERVPLNGTDAPNRDFPILGHRQTLLFEFGDIIDGAGSFQYGIAQWLDIVVGGQLMDDATYLTTPNCNGGTYGSSGTFDLYEGMGINATNGRINMMVEAWDRIMYSELATMGLVSTSTMDKMNSLYPRWTATNSPAEIYDYNNKSKVDNKTYKEFCQGIDYSEYFNHHGTGQGAYDGYMSGGWRVCNYHYNTMSSIIALISSQSGPTWGPAHEIGHQHQGTINLEGQTEVTNNFFSNVAVWYMGMGTSRYNGADGCLEQVLSAFNTDDNDAYTNNIWALAHLYYRLWLYYHLAGNNTQFWPRLYELCRQVPLVNNRRGTNDGSETLLRFYQHACDAAGEDLTEFFRAHGYLEVMENREVGDYYGATYNQSQAQIDEAIQSVKKKNYPANYAVLLINDGTSETTVKHDGKSKRSLWDGSATAELGSVNDFISGDVDVTTNYTAQLSSDGTITMTGGEGGVGFLMFNGEGELVAFSNKPTFKLSEEAKELYRSKGESAIVVVNADNEIIRLGDEIIPDPEVSVRYTVSVSSDPATSGNAYVNGSLTATVDAGSTVTLTATPYSSDYKFDGWYLNGTLVNTNSPYNPTVTSDVAYVARFSKETAVEPEPDQPAQTDGYYHVVSRATSRHEYLYNNAFHTGNSSCITLQSDKAVSTNNGIWYITFNDNNTLSVRNGDGKPVVVAGSNQNSPTACNELAIGQTTEVDGYTYYSFTNGLNCSDSGQDHFKIGGVNYVTTWAGHPDAADNQWRLESINMQGKSVYDVEISSNDVYVTYNNEYAYNDGFFITVGAIDESKLAVQGNAGATAVVDGNVIRVVEEPENPSGLDKTALRELIAGMQSLLGEVADKATAETPVALQTTDANADFYIWSNAKASDCDGVGTSALIDKNDDGTAKTGTFFGTVWQGGPVANYSHYIEIDLGTDIALSELSFDYTTRNSTHSDQRPTSIKILGSTDKDKYEEVTTISEGLPTGQNQKWGLSSPLTLNKYYRYLRFAVATQVGYFNMSDFNLYAPNAMSLNEIYMQSSLTTEQLFVISSALQNAISVADKNVTTDIYNSTLATLQEQYNLLLDVKNSNVTNKKELEELIDITKPLVESVAIIDENETKIALQCTDANAPYYIYCNAPGHSNGYEDYHGVPAMLDVDENGEPINSTHLHTTYTGNSHDDDLDHYLRVDMGENVALESFKFAYISRAGNTNNSPTKILVEGCNDLEKGDFEEIATITDANMNAVSYQSGVITNGKAYRYVRLMVKKTFMNDMYNGHPFFVLSHFEMTACKTVALKDEFASPNLSLSTLLDANNKMVDANVVKNKLYVAQPVYDSTLGDLQAAYNALNLAKQLKDIPVVITTDVNKPVLYKIKINRGGDKCLQYDEASGKVGVSDVRLNRAQAWYFMSGDDAKEDILIVPYKDDKKVLATKSFSEGAGKVDAVGASTAGYSYNWQITKVTDSEWYNITILDGNGTRFYFSNYNGVGEKMGFYNDSNDGGSQFQFVFDETDYSLPDSYYELYNLHQDCGGDKTSGPGIGQYSSSTAKQFNDIRSAVKTILEKAELSDEEYTEKYNELLNAFNALEVNLPVEGAYYRIKSACTQADRNGQLIYVNSENKPHFASPSDKNLSEFIWQFEQTDGGFYLKNLHTQSYIKTAGWSTQVELDATPNTITIHVLDNGANGQVRLNVSGSYPLHAQASESMLVGYHGDENSASAWYIEELTDEQVENIYYPYTLSAIGYGTLMLGFDAVIPEGIEAYWAESVNGIYIHMEPIADVIPANTAVILKRNEALPAEALSVTFKHSTVAGTTVKDNMLAGTLYKRIVKCDTDDVDNKVYVMQAKNGEVKMYWAYENYGADGKRIETNNGQNDDGGHIMNSANRAYLVVPQVQAQQSALNLRFGAFTGVEEVETENEKEEIYDLAGRKLNGITMPGFYIVNGKKVFVK